MSAWPSQATLRSFRPLRSFSPPDAFVSLPALARRVTWRSALWSICLIAVLAAEGVAVSHSLLWAAPLLCLVVVAVATELPLKHTLGALLFIRIMTDSSLSSATNRHSGSVNLSGAIAVFFVLIAVGLVMRRHKSLFGAFAAIVFIGVWTEIAIGSHGASTVTVREGVREASMVALAIMVTNSRGVLNLQTVTRLLQVAGALSALFAIYQFATHKGLDISGHIRSNGTFSHPNGAAMFYAIVATASLWRYLDLGRRKSDAILAGIFAAATISTFSIGGVATLLVMLMAYGSLRPGAFRFKVASYAVAFLIIVGFVATPLGSERLANESSTSLNSTVTKRTADTSLGWRFYKWQTLVPEWERGPFFGQGLGVTITVEGSAAENGTTAKVPHSEYVRYLVETGAVGLTIVLWMMAMVVGGLSKRRRIPDTHNGGTLGLAIVIGCLFNALGDNTFLYSTTGYAVALIVAATYGISKRQRVPARRAMTAA